MQLNITLAIGTEVNFRLELVFTEKQTKKGYSNAIYDQPPTQYVSVTGKAEAHVNYLIRFPSQHIETNVWDQLKLIHHQVLALLEIPLA